jgi:hypothetical protein
MNRIGSDEGDSRVKRGISFTSPLASGHIRYTSAHTSKPLTLCDGNTSYKTCIS